MRAGTRRTGAVGVMAEQVTARSQNGVAVAAAPLAARHAAAALDAGGNAFDAVLTAVLAEAVLLPPKCGPAGDLIAIVWEADQAQPEALLAIGGAPGALADRVSELRPTGPLSVGVPGAPAGYEALAERSRLGVDRAASIAERIGREGFTWSTVCTVLAEEAHELLFEHQPNGCVYLPEGRPIAPGAVVQLPGLGRAVAETARGGRGWWKGEVADAVLGRVQASGGVLSREDLLAARAEWVSTFSVTVAGTEVHATPAPTHGLSLLEALSSIEDFGDPADVYGSVRAAISSARERLADPSGTSMVSAVDREGNAALVVHSNSFPQFGSGLIVDGYDLILSNRAGRGFASSLDHPNGPVAGRRPATTLHAWAFRAPDGTRVLGATPGGANQMPWNAQTLARLASGDWDASATSIGEAVCAPRWQWNPADDSLTVEAGLPVDEMDGLARAARVESVERWALRSAMQIVCSLGSGEKMTAWASSDPRTQSLSLPI